jgi:hypothetical protein
VAERGPNSRREDPSDACIRAFAAAASAGCVLELKYRLLADMRPALRHVTHAKSLEDVEAAIIAEYAAHLTPAETALLSETRILRNKILHADFHVAHEKLAKSGLHLPDGLVTMVNLETGETAPATKDAPHHYVFGWLLQSFQNGMFRQAELRFWSAVEIINRLLRLG